MYFWCRTDNSWQEDFDIDCTGEFKYDVFILDGIQEPQNVDFAILEDLVYHDVTIKRRGKVGGKLAKGTPFIFTSNKSPSELFGPAGSIVVARSIVINTTGVRLFPLLDHIRHVHGLPEYQISMREIPADFF